MFNLTEKKNVQTDSKSVRIATAKETFLVAIEGAEQQKLHLAKGAQKRVHGEGISPGQRIERSPKHAQFREDRKQDMSPSRIPQSVP